MRFVSHSLSALIAWFLLFTPAHAGEASWQTVDKVLGQAGRTLPGGVHRYSWPRRDLSVSVAGTRIDAALALGSWAGFTSDEPSMAMGDLVLLPTEVTPVIRALQRGGLEVLAVHNHLIEESPQIIYVHFAGHGVPHQMAEALKAALEQTKTPTAAPAAAPELPAADRAAFDQVQASLGRKGSMNGRILQVGVPRAAKIEEEGAEVPATLGMATSLNFQVVGGKVATTGDFVLVADEVNPVIRELESHGILVTALHSHMLKESPRLFFMHFWAVGDAAAVGSGLKAALAKMAVE